MGALDAALAQLCDLCLSLYRFLSSLFTPALTVSFPKSHTVVTVIGKQNQSIGEGAFSTVYQGIDRDNPNKRYAVKRMLLQSMDLTNMARNEVDSYQRFTHPHIIQLLDYVETIEKGKAVIYMLLPYCSRGSLRDELNRVLSGAIRRPSLQTTLRRYLSILQAVDVLHSYQPSYVHFDIKPEVRIYIFSVILLASFIFSIYIDV
jgi:hypothetical protein